MKRILSLLLFFAPLAAHAGEVIEVDTIFYELNADTKSAEVACQSDYVPVNGTPSSKWLRNYGDIVIPETITDDDGETYTVTSLANNAFNKLEYLKSLVIPETVTSMGNSVFTNCKALGSLTLPASLIGSEIPDEFFSGCNGLSEVYTTTNGEKTNFLTSGAITSVGISAFSNCYKITSFNGENCTSVGKYAFYKCTALESITLSNAITEIPAYCFYQCTSLPSINIPDDSPVTSIGEYAFFECTALESINIPDGVTSLGKACFNLCHVLSTINLPDGITSIGDYCFSGCYVLTLTSTRLPSGLTSLGEYCFFACRYFTSIDIPEGVTTIGSNCFANCLRLEEIILPATLTSVGQEAFDIGDYYLTGDYGITSVQLKTVICYATTPSEIADDAFRTDMENCTLYVPRGSVDTYKSSGWANYFSIIEEMVPTIDPADGAEVESITEINVSWPAGLVLSSEDAYEAITLKNADGDTVATIISAEASDDGSTYTLTLSDRFYVHSPKFPAGTYTLNIPESVFILGAEEVANEEVNVQYTLIGDEPIPTLGFDPAPVDENGEGGTVEELHTINISVVEGLSLALNKVYLSRISLTNADNEQVAGADSCEGDEDAKDDDGNFTSYVLTLDDTITDAGEYTLYIPASTFTLTHGTGDTSKSVATYATFVIPEQDSDEEGDDTTGISGVASATDSSVEEVYNLAGQRVASPVRGQVNVVRMTDGTVKKVLQK